MAVRTPPRWRVRVVGVLTVTSAVVAGVVAAAPPAAAVSNPASLVDPFIGTGITSTLTGTAAYAGEVGQVHPSAGLPFSMMSWGPDTNTYDPSDRAGFRLYAHESTTMTGFSLFHTSGGGSRYVPFMPVAGNLGSSSPGSSPSSYYARFSHADEQAAPGYYRVELDNDVTVELTGTYRAGYGRFTYPGSTGTMIVNMLDDRSDKNNGPNDVRIDVGARRISGHVNQWSGLYFVAEFDRPFTVHGTFSDSTVSAGSTSATPGKRAGAYVTFDTSSTKTVGVKVAVSYVSTDNAARNLQHDLLDPGLSFDQVRSAATDAWNSALRKIDVSGGTTTDTKNFYSALWRVFQQPTAVSDVNGDYRGWDGQTHNSGNRTEYSLHSPWDSVRSQLQLLAFLVPHETSDMMQSVVDAAVQNGGWSHRGIMGSTVDDSFNSGHYAALAVAYMAGAKDFDAGRGLAAERDTATKTSGNPVRRWQSEYAAKGYVPSDPSHQPGDLWPPDETLSYSNADFAISQMAGALDDTATRDRLLARSDYWRGTFNPSFSDRGHTGYVWARRSDGSWEGNFGAANGGCYDHFQEGTSAQFSFNVPYDLAGVIELMGGRSAVVSRLDDVFSKLNDGCTSAHAYLGNEPDFVLPWIYNWAGQPAKTQDVVRRMLRDLFLDTPGGLPGNDDWGATSAMYVWAALGLYPEIPGVPGLTVASPLFSSATITLQNGRKVEITAPNASTSRYVQSLRVNGSAHDTPWIPLSSITDGGTLAFTLGTEASSWGAANPPPSFGVGAPGGEQLVDPGFEAQGSKTLSAVWTGSGNQTGVDLDENRARSGRNNGYIYADDANWHQIEQVVPVKKNTRYTLSAYVRTSTDLDGNAAFLGVKTTDYRLIGEVKVGPAVSYTRYSVTVDTGGNDRIRVYVGSWGPRGSWLQADDWSLRPQG